MGLAFIERQEMARINSRGRRLMVSGALFWLADLQQTCNRTIKTSLYFLKRALTEDMSLGRGNAAELGVANRATLEILDQYESIICCPILAISNRLSETVLKHLLQINVLQVIRQLGNDWPQPEGSSHNRIWGQSSRQLSF
jgi:hypothetical protein